MKIVNITPVAYKLNKPQPNTLGVRLISDNLVNRANLYWLLSNVTPVTISGSTKDVSTQIDSGNFAITGSQYTAWTGDNDTLVTLVAASLGLTIVP